MSNIVAMAIKDLHLLWRDRFGVFWVVVFPLMFALFFGAIFGGAAGDHAAMRVAVVDQDGSDGSAAFIKALASSDAIDVARRKDGTLYDRDSARGMVQRGDAIAYLVIPKGYSDSGGMMFTPDSPELEVGIDPVRKAEAGYLQGLIMAASFKRMQSAMADPASMQPQIRKYIGDIERQSGLDSAQRSVLLDFMKSLDSFMGSVEPSTMTSKDAPDFQPVRISQTEVTPEGVRPPSAFAVSFPQSMAWGIIGCTAGFAIGLVQERTQGTFLRLRVAPQAGWQILAGKGLACFAACTGVLLTLTAVGGIFGVSVRSPTPYVMAVVSIGLCFTGLMMLLSTLGRTERAVAGAGWAAMMAMAMLGGGMVPLMFMPSWMAPLSDASPIKWSILSLEGALWRGFTVGQMLVPTAILTCVGVATFGAGVWVMGRRREV